MTDSKEQPNSTGLVGEEERQTRMELSAAYRLAYHFGYTYMIYNHITARVPGEGHQFLINEYGLHLADPKAREFLMEQTEEYFFGSGQTAETHYVPPEQ